jgi:uncharacterized protein YdiU (UPF0061 family)
MQPDTQANRMMTDPPIMAIADFLADPVEAAAFPRHMLRWRDNHAAADVALDSLSDDAWINHFGRFAPLPRNLPQPLALRYHGHQFGVYNPDIGDGRGFLFAQLRDQQGRLLDLGTKGSGQTPYSRFGDGRLTLKGAVRELLATEMLTALGVETSRTFSIIETGEALTRNDEPSPTRSAVLVRLSHSHIRIGSFQRLAAIEAHEDLARLTRYCLAVLLGHDPLAVESMDIAEAAARLLTETVERTARLAASYMAAGFVHGVLNTDNINITGESFDYGPWRFASSWDPAFVAAYFDQGGRYAFGRQPAAIHWNCGQLALALRAVCPAEPLIAALETFAPAYQRHVANRMLWRLGYEPRVGGTEDAIVEAIERAMIASGSIDQFFFDWARGGRPASIDSAEAHELDAILANYAPLGTRAHIYWQATCPCSMLIGEVEDIWTRIAEQDDWAALYAKIDAVRTMGDALTAR